MIYLIEAVGADRIKIGYTDDKFDRRLKALKTGSCHPLKVLATFPGDKSVEARLHNVCGFRRVSGEWFKASPAIRSLADVDLDTAITQIEAEAAEYVSRGARYAEKAYATVIECIKELVSKHGAIAVGYACGSDQSTVRGWLRGESRISFDRLVALVNAAPDAFAPYLMRGQELTTADRLAIVEQHLAVIRREAA